MENFFIITIYLLIGIGLNRLTNFPKETANVLNQFVIYISLPALVLLTIPELEISFTLLTPIIFCWVVLIFTASIILFLASFFKWNKKITGCMLLLIPMGNTSFLGIPMVEAFFGIDAVKYALLYDQPGTFLALATYGSVIIAVFGNSGVKVSASEILKRVFTFPPFIALIAAFIFRTVEYSSIFTNILSVLASTLIPLVMIAVGFQLKIKIHTDELKPLGYGLILKLIIIPAAALLITRMFGFNDEVTNVSIFESAMPPMVSAGALAIMAGLAPNLAAALVGFGIILSFITLPVLFYLL